MQFLRQLMLVIMSIALIGFGGCSWFSTILGIDGVVREQGNGYAMAFIVWGFILALGATGIFFLMRLFFPDNSDQQTEKNRAAMDKK